MKKAGPVTAVFAGSSLVGALALLAPFLLPSAAFARIDLVTLPARDRVQLTIYNSADLTLARDVRTLTMRKGANRLQFSWVNTLIDPTSLEMLPLAQARDIEVQNLVFPPRASGLGIWNLESGAAGKAPFEITYLTSGLSWQAYYLATLTSDESAMRLEGYVRVNNRSGEDYENAETRLIVGKVNLLDSISELARRQPPYGSPRGDTTTTPPPGAVGYSGAMAPAAAYAPQVKLAMAEAPKEIRKEGLSEYFLYTIEGTEDIPDGWGKRLISFTAPAVPVRNLYRYEEEKYGRKAVRFLSFANDEAHKLGKEPVPDGMVKVFRREKGDDLSYIGAQQVKYIPKGGEVELNLGPTDQVSVTATAMEYSTLDYDWNFESISGWRERTKVRVEAANSRDTAVRVEVRRNFPGTAWALLNEGDFGKYEKVDADTVQYTLELPPRSKKAFTYQVTMDKGSLASR